MDFLDGKEVTCAKYGVGVRLFQASDALTEP
jgi:hypothetical protein